MVRLCPVCDEPLWIVELEGVEVDRCARCEGVWLDEGELEIVSRCDTQDPLMRVQREGEAYAEPAFRKPSAASPITATADGGAGARTRAKRRCPRCSARMREVVMGSDRPVYVDRCPQGHGLWFDRDELGQLLAQFGPGAGRSVAYLEQLFGRQAEAASGADRAP